MSKPIGLDQEIQARIKEIEDARSDSSGSLEDARQALDYAMHSWNGVSGITLGTKETVEAMLGAIASILDYLVEQS